MRHLSPRELHKGGPGGKAPLLGTSKDMLSKALEWVSVSIGVLLLGNMEGRSFLRAPEINRYIKRYIKMLSKRVSLSIGALLGNLDGITCWDFLKKRKVYLGSFIGARGI